MTTNPSPDAVEALIKILNEARCNSPRTVGNRELAQRIIDAGFTITRQPAMTDAELEREAVNIVQTMDIGVVAGTYLGHVTDRIIELAKKYMG